MFVDYDWPGNIRELQNALESAMNRADGDTLERVHFSFFSATPTTIPSPPPATQEIRPLSPTPEFGSLRTMKTDLEYAAIRDAMLKTRGNKTEAAALLGISRNALYKKLKKYQ